MKSLKSIYEANLTQSLYEVSILADIDDQIEAYDNSIPDRIEKWIKENYNFYGTLKISKKPNKDGLHEVSGNSVAVKNKDITSLTNGMFEWVKAKSFDCSYCPKLESLEGAPREVEKDFECEFCYSLTSLTGAPEIVKNSFYCYNCTSLDSLEGSPKEVGNFTCFNCKKAFTIEDIKKVSDVKGRIYV